MAFSRCAVQSPGQSFRLELELSRRPPPSLLPAAARLRAFRRGVSSGRVDRAPRHELLARAVGAVRLRQPRVWRARGYAARLPVRAFFGLVARAAGLAR